MKIAGKTDIGMGRSENQDNFRAGRFPDDTVWAVVCDGMGGAAGGALASRLAVDTVEELFCQKMPAVTDEEQLRGLMDLSVDMANQMVYRRSREDAAMRGMGTTLVLLVLQGGKAHLLHAGDSRAYLYREGCLSQLTKDHSVVQELVERGALTEEEAAGHPQRNVITRALGVEAGLRCDYTDCTVQSGDILLLCSDGLTNFATEEQLEEVLAETEFFSAPDQMIRLALEANGQDNITALLVKVEPAEGK